MRKTSYFKHTNPSGEKVWKANVHIGTYPNGNPRFVRMTAKSKKGVIDLAQSELVLNRLLSPAPQNANRKKSDKYQEWRDFLGTNLDEWGEDATVALGKSYWNLVRRDFEEIIDR